MMRSLDGGGVVVYAMTQLQRDEMLAQMGSSAHDAAHKLIEDQPTPVLASTKCGTRSTHVCCATATCT
ncbi:hypothetical protein B2K11_09445 [Microbacterium sp. B35-30]|nr:hypothetical protein B2K11_09445 [Microbacterium sp. B35-30]